MTTRNQIQKKALIVDTLTPDKIYATVTTPRKIFKNIETIDPQLKEDFESIFIEHNKGFYSTDAGKYVCTFTASLDYNDYQMVILDYMNNERAMKQGLLSLTNEQADLVKAAFYRVAKNPRKN